MYPDIDLNALKRQIIKAHNKRRIHKKDFCVGMWRGDFKIVSEDFYFINPNSKCVKLYSTATRQFRNMHFSSTGKLEGNSND